MGRAFFPRPFWQAFSCFLVLPHHNESCLFLLVVPHSDPKWFVRAACTSSGADQGPQWPNWPKPPHNLTSCKVGHCWKVPRVAVASPGKAYTAFSVSPWARPPLHGPGYVGSAVPSRTNFSFMFKCLSKLQTSGSCPSVGLCPVLPTTHPASGRMPCTPPPPAQLSLPFCRQNGPKGKLGERAGLVTVSCVPSVDVLWS